MVDRIRKLFKAKEDENGHPVGYAEDLASKVQLSNMPVAVQEVDAWLRRHVPSKGTEEDCLYCKLVSCSVLAAASVWIIKSAPKTMNKYEKRSSKVAYGAVTSFLALCMSGIAVARWFDINVSNIDESHETTQDKKQLNIAVKTDSKSSVKADLDSDR